MEYQNGIFGVYYVSISFPFEKRDGVWEVG